MNYAATTKRLAELAGPAIERRKPFMLASRARGAAVLVCVPNGPVVWNTYQTLGLRTSQPQVGELFGCKEKPTGMNASWGNGSVTMFCKPYCTMPKQLLQQTANFICDHSQIKGRMRDSKFEIQTGWLFGLEGEPIQSLVAMAPQDLEF
jgi:hypothetical protein